MENEMKKLAEKLIELRKMATKVYHSKMKHMTDYLCGEDEDGDFVMAEFNRGMPNWKRDLEFCIFASNHAADIAERMLRLEKALELALYYVEGDSTYEAVKMKVEAILRGES